MSQQKQLKYHLIGCVTVLLLAGALFVWVASEARAFNTCTAHANELSSKVSCARFYIH